VAEPSTEARYRRVAVGGGGEIQRQAEGNEARRCAREALLGRYVRRGERENAYRRRGARRAGQANGSATHGEWRQNAETRESFVRNNQ